MSDTGRRGRREQNRATEMKPHKPAKVKSPILESMTSSPGGPHTPGEKAKRKKKQK